MKKTKLLYVLLIISLSCNKIKVATTSMEGTLKKGTVLNAHRADKIERNDIVIFKHKERDDEVKWVFRAVGIPSDKIEMKAGKLFVNDKEFDEPTNLKMSYSALIEGTVNPKQLEQFECEIADQNHFLFHLTQAEMQQLKTNPVIREITPVIADSGKLDSQIFQATAMNNWNADNFGPLVVPIGFYFLLGDNRHNAMDSRYIGFVSRNDITEIVELN